MSIKRNVCIQNAMHFLNQKRKRFTHTHGLRMYFSMDMYATCMHALENQTDVIPFITPTASGASKGIEHRILNKQL